MKSIKNFANYAVTSDGKIWSHRNQKFLKQAVGNHGYCVVTLCGVNKREVLSVHRLMLETFRGSCPKGMEARHLNGNRQDNRLKNLKWGTVKENAQDSILHKTMPRGIKHGLAKLTDAKILEIRWLRRTSGCSYRKLAKMFGVTFSNIRFIIKRETWTHV